MKSTTQNMLYIGLALIFVSIIMMASNFDKIIDSLNEKMQYEKKVLDVDPANLERVSISTSNASVNIIPTDSPKIKISYYENKYVKYTNSIENKTLIFKSEQKGVFPFFCFWGNKTMVIEVPSSLVLDFSIKTSNGRMEAKDMSFSNLEFRTSNGSIELTNVNSKADIRLNSSNGSITFKHVTASNLMDMRTSNGSLNLSYTKSNEINGNSSNGHIAFDYLTSDDITLRTSNGRIYGSVVGENNDYAKYMRTSNGHVTIDGSRVDKMYQADKDKDKKVDLSTSNGSITLDFE